MDRLHKLDFHVHSSERSECASTDEETQIRTAIAAGLDGIAFTDHHAMASSERLDELNRKYRPFKIYAGIEITADKEDWLVLGLRDEELARAEGWGYDELVTYVRRRNGYIVLAHPFRYSKTVRVELNGNAPDGIEYRSVNTPPAREEDIRKLAGEHGMALFCNSDAHTLKMLGTYFNVLAELPEDDRSLVEALRRLK